MQAGDRTGAAAECADCGQDRAAKEMQLLRVWVTAVWENAGEQAGGRAGTDKEQSTLSCS